MTKMDVHGVFCCYKHQKKRIDPLNSFLDGRLKKKFLQHHRQNWNSTEESEYLRHQKINLHFFRIFHLCNRKIIFTISPYFAQGDPPWNVKKMPLHAICCSQIHIIRTSGLLTCWIFIDLDLACWTLDLLDIRMLNPNHARLRKVGFIGKVAHHFANLPSGQRCLGCGSN